MGKLDVYKAHHHCSSHSSNDQWLSTTHPTVAIISAGDGNTYGHPTNDCLERLHHVDAKTYWTENGNGADPVAGSDLVSGNTIVTVDDNAHQYTVRSASGIDTYAIGGSAVTSGATPPSIASYAWSKNSKYYHYSTCDWVKRINAENLVRGTKPPDDKELHPDCPTHH